jgi:hypothetical protein
MKVYGKMNIMGTEYADSCLLNYLQIDPILLNSSSDSFTIIKCTNKDYSTVRNVAEHFRGSIYTKAEQLDQPDVELSQMDAQYRKYGLSRKRYIWIAVEKSSRKPKGMILAYRGLSVLILVFLKTDVTLWLIRV